MSFLKLGEAIEIQPSSMEEFSSVEPMIDQAVMANFSKFAEKLKRIAPKAEDFLYFSAVIIHAAEASLVNEDGTPRMTAKGEVAKAHWDKSGGTWRWKANHSSIQPYKNSNGDIFPEEELVKAYKKWVGKPLCIDHKSSSVDHVRGFIVDTYYDRKSKRVIALCALDKFNYPDLARKVATGYSNSVSMGTAVGKAICSDCAQVAKSEADFCKCMRNRTRYGEINIDLNPIELSIVVNGADPQAKIKDVIAAAETLNSYIDSKEAEIKKLADFKYNIQINFSDPDKQEGGKSGSVSLESSSIDDLKSQVEKAFEDFRKITEDKENLSKNTTNDSTLGETASSPAMNESEMPGTDQSIAPPSDRMEVGGMKQLDDQMIIIKSKLDSMQKDFEKLAQQFTGSNKQEEIMAGNKDNINKKAYFQGAGGVNEPTPGQVKYEKDPLQDHLRDKEDKQMVGQSPFPDVGPVDGMYPGYESFDKGELERKKMLARAEAEQRALKRQSTAEAVKTRLGKIKEAYFQGGGEENEPTPGKQKYPVDKLQEHDRDKEDKQMVGQKPFPGVGDPEGLHPSPESADQKDELKRKEMLQRASLKARFVKAAKADGTLDHGKCTWEVFSGDKRILSASVNDITAGNAEALFAGVYTKEFATDLINKVRKLGVEKVAEGFAKKAQDAGMPPTPPPPADGPGAPPALPPADPTTPDAAGDDKKDGDPKEKALDLADKAVAVISDLNDTIKELTGEQKEMGDVGAMHADDTDSSDSKVSTAAMLGARKELNGMLLEAVKESHETLTAHEKELRDIVSMYELGKVTAENKSLVNGLVDESIVEAKEAIAKSLELVGAFVKYARGTKLVVKRAQEAALADKAHGDDTMAHKDDSLMAMVDSNMSATDAFDAMLAEDMDQPDFNDSEDDSTEETPDSNDAGNVTTDDPNKAQELATKGLDVHVASLDTTTRAGRDAERAKIAAEMKWNPVLNDFHKHLEDPTFDVKPSDNGGHVETVEEIHESMLDVANTPSHAKKQAEAINSLVVSGELDPADMDILVANGVDPAAIKYWKQFYGEMGPEGSQFATELVKDHAKAQAEEEMAQYRVKLARANELAYEMADRELIARDRTSISNQVDEIMSWNDASFESVRKVIASQKPVVKTAGRMPQVGILGVSDNHSSGATDSEDLASLLAQAFSGNSRSRQF